MEQPSVAPTRYILMRQEVVSGEESDPTVIGCDLSANDALMALGAYVLGTCAETKHTDGAEVRSFGDPGTMVVVRPIPKDSRIEASVFINVWIDEHVKTD